MPRHALPPAFLSRLRDLEASYLKEADPIRQSGFSGGAKRWRAEREAILEPVSADGEILDVGCANGYLLECLVRWAGDRGLELTPYGLDHSDRLIELARQRLPQYADHFYVGNAWNWRPPARYRYVYSLHDCVPDEFLAPYVERLLRRVVAPGGLLILGAYGSRSRGAEPLDLTKRLTALGHVPLGRIDVGEPPISRFVWLAA
jgi:SAM-dependent methyltransferase